MKRILTLFSIALFFGITLVSCEKEEDDDGNTPGEPKEQLIQISTAHGDMIIWLWDTTSLHKSNFLALADTGFFDGTTFHRIIDDFVIQGGDPNSKDSDPNNDGSGGPGYRIPAEIYPSLTHIHGAVGAARTQNPLKESSGSQFYIVDDPNGTHFLDGNYTVFGQCISGLDVINTIANQPKNGADRPLTDVKMTVTVIEKTLSSLESEYNFVP